MPTRRMSMRHINRSFTTQVRRRAEPIAQIADCLGISVGVVAST
jgi:hypothetical protein